MQEDLDQLVAEITAAADGDDEQLRAVVTWIENNTELPADGFVIGEPVEVTSVSYDGNTRRGIVARCHRQGDQHTVSWADVTFPAGTREAVAAAAYRAWLGIGEASSPQQRRHKARPDEISPGQRLDLVVLRVSERAARCRLPGTAREISLRSSELWTLAPGVVATIEVAKSWSFSGHPYVSGKIVDTGVDVDLLQLVPLRLEGRGPWPRGAKPATRDAFELEGPDGAIVYDLDEARHLIGARQMGDAEKILMGVLYSDIRCIAAHELLAQTSVRLLTGAAAHSYEVGLRIGELSLGGGFDGVLPAAFAGNEPFLNCLLGHAICHWRTDNADDALAALKKLLRLDPDDSVGAGSCLHALESGLTWTEFAAQSGAGTGFE